MSDDAPTQIVCIVPRLGESGGGGKMNAVFKRMNLLAARPDTFVTLLNLQHGVNQRIIFEQLKVNGVFTPQIRHQSLFSYCTPPTVSTAHDDEPVLPAWDRKQKKGTDKARILYFDGDRLVMRDNTEKTVAGQLTIRQVLSDPDCDIRLKYLDDELVESLMRFGDGIVQKSYYVNGSLSCEVRQENRAFIYADSRVTGKRYRGENVLHKDLVSHSFPEDAVVFVDGITTAYLSRHITAHKVLFLHADHRAPNGKVVPRSRYLIEHFDGDAIVTATHVHKARLEADTHHAAPIRVIPHYTQIHPRKEAPRAHICTVSRLDLDGKPIHQCIEAFTRIMHLIPEVNYLIYGSGLGQARLEQLIKHHGCENRVFLMGFTSTPGDVFSTSLLSLAPTMTEGFGLALLESLTHGCPVISYDVDYGPRELIRPGQNGELVAPGDIDGIAHAILKVLEHRRSYQAACLQSIQRNSFDEYRNNYHNLIDDIAGRHRLFDISAPDLKVETREALHFAPQKHKARLLDLYIKLSVDSLDLEGTYWGFQQKLALFPRVQRPLMRCIWLSRRLGRMAECRAYLALFEQRFPVNHADFVQRYPDFLETANAMADND
jgi:poly(glycerol-phosphate) alpha-glucosyltransferase